ncbi:MAG: TetR/AcrR family transcriptional regulator [Alphaproteobacteria bacterium]|jgi:AcrR family transcriptional regulator|nr:TetR/AcrR family transcriptional regulator [Alphaproteobacteria bacterium]MBT5859884.1 TetR/AcrR family transcriptional regulator [Alphaproteobacteria bacterium]
MNASRRDRGVAAARKSKRQALAAAAWRVFLREGLGGTTARAIAQETGGSVGALYSYFPGTNGVVQELALGSVTELTRKVAKSVGFERSVRGRAELAIAEILEIYGPGTRGAELLPVIFGTGQKDEDGEFAARLNGKLIVALTPVAEGFQAVGMEPSQAQAKALSLACFVFGLVMFHSTGRMAAMEISAKNVTDTFLSDVFPP